MRYGELSNSPSPRIVIAFEGIIGNPPDNPSKKYLRAMRRHNWYGIIAGYELNEMSLRKLLDLTWRQNLNIDIVTWHYEEGAQAVNDILDRQGIPVRGCFASTPEKLARDLAYNPDIVAVYDSDPEHCFTFGSKGIYVTDLSQIGRI